SEVHQCRTALDRQEKQFKQAFERQEHLLKHAVERQEDLFRHALKRQEDQFKQVLRQGNLEDEVKRLQAQLQRASLSPSTSFSHTRTINLLDDLSFEET
ncbi:hypothetical protein CPB97_009469, partial [Podila verticillata]